MTVLGRLSRTDEASLDDPQQVRDDAAFAAVVRAVQGAVRRGDLQAQAVALMHLGSLYTAPGQNDDALHVYRAAYACAHRGGERLTCARLLTHVAALCWDCGEVMQALALYQRALTLYRGLGCRLGQADVLVTMGHCYAAMGHRDRAMEVLSAALSRYDGLQATWGAACYWGTPTVVLHQLLRAQTLARVLQVPVETVAVVVHSIRHLLERRA